MAHRIRWPEFHPPEGARGRLARLFYNYQIASFALVGLFYFLQAVAILPIHRPYLRVGLLLPVFVVCAILTRRNRLEEAVWLYLLSCWGVFMSIALGTFGITGPLMLGTFVVMGVIANSFFRPRASYLFLGFLTATNLLLALAQQIGWLHTNAILPSPLTLWVVQTMMLLLAQLLLSNTIFSAREAFEETQRELEERRKLETVYRRAISAADGVPYSFDIASRTYTFIGDGIQQLIGYSKEEFNHSLLNRLIEHTEFHGGLSGQPFEAVHKLFKEGELSEWRIDYCIRTRTGQLRWLSDAASLVRDRRQQPVSSTGILMDITERKQAEAALRERDAILQAVVFAGEAFLKEPDWRVCLPAVLELLGQETRSSHAYIYENQTGPDGTMTTSMCYEWTAAAATPGLGLPAFQNVPVPWPGVDGWSEAMQTGRPFQGSTVQMSPNEAHLNDLLGVKSYLDVPIMLGHTFWGLIGFGDSNPQRQWSEVEIDSLKIAASVLSAAIQRQAADQEIRTLNTELEQRVRLRTAELEAANRELESFAYSVSHDLRAPLRAIDGYSRMVLLDYHDCLDADAHGMLGNVRQATLKMQHLIDDLLKLSRLTRAEMKLERVDLSRMAAAILDELRRHEPERAVEVSVTPGIETWGDTRLFQVALENLLGNAWKFTSRATPARIEFGVAENDAATHTLTCYVRDNGAGFRMEYANKLFTPFQRLHTEEDFAGTGIGLATVRRIIQRHGGQVWAEAAPDCGATFFLTLSQPPLPAGD